MAIIPKVVAQGQLAIHVEELQVSGLATIHSISESSEIADGDGSVVISLFRTRVAENLVQEGGKGVRNRFFPSGTVSFLFGSSMGAKSTF